MKLGIGWAFFFSLVCLDVSAQEAPRPFAKIEIEPNSVIVGQPARLRVTVLVPTWFSKPAVYPSFELPNLITRLPPNSSFPTTERINGQNWSGIVRDYVLYPQSRARYVISDQRVRVAFADPQTRKPVSVTVDVPQVSLVATVPPGAESLDPFIAGSALTIEQKIEGETEDLAPGDAVVRIVTVTVQGAPVMFIPALLAMRHDQGYTAYAIEPELQEVLDARTGQLTSKRTERVTYVFEGSGELELA